MSDEIKVYPDEDNAAMVVCPQCQIGRMVSTTKMRKCGHRVRLKCSCEATFTAFVECRRACRKETNLVGFYTRTQKVEERQKVFVKNISMRGIGFVTAKSNELKQGDEIAVEVTLDDRRASRIRKEAVVLRVGKDNYVGCKFKKPPAYADPAPTPSDKALGFYVMP